MKTSLIISMIVLLTSMNARSRDTIRVSLTKSGNYLITNGAVVKFSDFDPKRVDTIRFSPKDGGQVRNLTNNQLTFLMQKTGFQLTVSDQKLVEIDQSIVLPASLHIGTTAGTNRSDASSSGGAAKSSPPPVDPQLSGVYFDDARLLLNSGKSSEDVKKLLAKPPYSFASDNDINPYLKDFLDKLDTKALGTVASSGVDAQAGLAGMLNPTTAIDALGTFIANRFRQEVTISYLDQLRTWLDNSLVQERVLFPASYVVLAQSDPFQYTTFLNTLRESFGEDLNQLPPHTIAYLDANKDLIRNPDVRLSLKTTLHVVDQVRLNAEPLIVVRQLDSQSWLTSEDPAKALPKGLRLLAVLVRGASRQKDAKTLTLLSGDDLKLLQGNQDLIKAYLGLWLLGERVALKAIPIDTTTTAYAFLTKSSNAISVNSLINYLQTLNNQFQLVLALNKEGLAPYQNTALRQSQPEEFREVYFQYIEAIRTLVEKGVLDMPFVNFNDLQKRTLNQFFTSSKQLVQITKYVSQKRYGLALSGTVTVVLPYLSNNPIRRKAVYRAVITELNKQQTTGIALVASTTFDEMANKLETWVASNPTQKAAFEKIMTDAEKSIDAQPDWLNQLMKYGNFMVTVVNAKTADEMAAALDAAALPVGSYRIKRNSQFSIGLNAYGGLYGGFGFGTVYQAVETTNTAAAPANGASSGGFIFGPSAPIGVTLGWGSGRGINRKDGRFWGFSVPLLDVGGVFAFRLLDGKTQLPDLSWRNVFTPGLYVVHAPKWLPALAISGGVQYGPELRGISLNTDQKTKANFNVQGWRAGLTLTVDIPIFNLYSRYDQ